MLNNLFQPRRIGTVLIAGIAVLSVAVLLRSHITIFGSWWVTISEKKFLALGLFYLAGIGLLVLVEKRKAVLIAAILLSGASMYSAKDDYFAPRLGGNYMASDNSYIYSNNEFLTDKAAIRGIKSGSPDVVGMWAALCLKYDSFCSDPGVSEFAKLEKATLIVSSLLDFGNPREYTGSGPGCVGNSQETPEFRASSFALVRQATIGCCDDFARLTASFLNYLDIENEYVLIPGHIANRARIDGKWVFADSMNTLIVEGLFDSRGTAKRFHLYPHSNVDLSSNRYDVLNFQRQEISFFSDDVHFVMNYMSFRSSANVDADMLQ